MDGAMDEAALIFDRPLIRARRRRAAARGPATFLLERVATDLSERLDAVLRRFALVADIGTPDNSVREALASHSRLGRVIAVNAVAEHLPCDRLAVAADEELLPFGDGTLDLVVSGLALQFVNDMPGTLVQIRRALKPDGLFIAALLGGDTLTELRQALTAAEAETIGGASPRVAPFADVRALGLLLQRAGFTLPVSDVDRVTVRYDTPLSLLDDLRRMGASNPLLERRRTPLRRGTLMRAAEIYARRFGDPDGRVRATFDIIWLSGWAPHSSQQQPLRPGSAVVRLADALGAKELSAGDKAAH
jgi:SAM-dependent methyltransferase